MLKTSTRPLRILDFDIENRPLAYLGADFTTAEITAIAASWVGESKVHVWLLDNEESSTIAMLEGFLDLYEAADVVTGHYILEHDLPIINGALMELEYAPLAAKQVSDTKVHLLNRKYISASQENLSEMLGIPAAKFHMSNAMWREANRLTPKGIKITERRVVDDVKQHKLLFKKLVALGYLGPSVTWSP